MPQRSVKPLSKVTPHRPPLFFADSVILRGRTGAVIQGSRRILFYHSDRICVDLGAEKVSITGAHLVCTSFSAGAVALTGEIDAVGFCPGTCRESCPALGEGEK